MPAKTEKQRKFMGAELQRKREGKKTKSDTSEKELEKYAESTCKASVRRGEGCAPRIPIQHWRVRW